MLCCAASGTHSLFHFYAGVTGDPNILKVTGVAKIDDQQVTYFDSITMKSVPKTEWIKQKGEDKWNRTYENGIFFYNRYKNYMPNIMKLFNHSMSDVHTLQLLYGCELEDDGTNRGYLQIGYDGEDFDSFDMEKLNWIPANPLAANFKKILDANEVQTKHLKTNMEIKCTQYLKQHFNYANDNMERKGMKIIKVALKFMRTYFSLNLSLVPPLISLLQKNSSSPVICHATGYPKDITMTWMKNHEELYEDVDVSSTLPNEDGSFQKSISLSVNTEEWKKHPDVYRCVVQHVGAEKEIVVLLNENNIKSNSGYVKGNTCIEITDEPLRNST
ncbi:major histocompatibility complex class I-related gene protein-like [Misgurnus anguillicaudatus]|uniref:major histocompatibility complex class I-related gene protein-like n=1 Tax=Misgurnus anguillicaudatus TaxID=75329 RepID=UPI003CCFC0A5